MNTINILRNILESPFRELFAQLISSRYSLLCLVLLALDDADRFCYDIVIGNTKNIISRFYTLSLKDT